MKKGIILFVLLFGFFSVNAEENLENNYTVIDCIDGSDQYGEAFNPDKPYQSLKTGIESTITYINKNFNKPGLEEIASGKVFKIKINCSTNTLGYKNINLDFNGYKYKNQLIIEGTHKNSFVISDIYFSSRIDKTNNLNGSNITIKNAMFLNTTEQNYYFNSISAIKILDSYIKLNTDQNLGSRGYYMYYNTKYYYFINAFNIQNTKIDIDIDKNYQFGVPGIMKDSIVTFKNNDKEKIYNIDFYQLHSARVSIHGYISKILLVSNIFDFGGNNFKTTSSIKMSYLNNKFTNFNDMIFGNRNDVSSNSVFVNNYIGNDKKLNISHYKNLYNNIFKSGYSSTYDLFNLRRNFKESDTDKNGLGWIFKIRNNIEMFAFDMTNFSLYKELTGKELTQEKKGVYIIYE